MNINWWWVLGMIGAPALLRVTITAVEQWREWRQPKLGYADQSEVIRLEPVLRELMPQVFGLALEDCFISDESSLYDFEPEITVAQSSERIEKLYGVSVTDLPDLRLVSICDAIAGKSSD